MKSVAEKILLETIATLHRLEAGYKVVEATQRNEHFVNSAEIMFQEAECCRVLIGKLEMLHAELDFNYENEKTSSNVKIISELEK